VSRGHSRQAGTPTASINTSQTTSTRSLPSWSCGFDSRHPLRISLLSGAAASRDLLWISSWYGVGGGLGDLLDEIDAAIFSLDVLAQDNDQ
jgi:hypothetical protein